MAELQDLLAKSAALHNELCPRQILGVRIGMYAGDLLELAFPQADKRAFAFVETDGCFADGVSVATGCWPGRRTMRIEDYGKPAATIVDTLSQRAIRVWPNLRARELARSICPNTRSRRDAYLEAYRILPSETLLCASEVQLNLSMERLISRPGRRVCCAECGEEIMNEREVSVAGRIICRSCAGDSYFSWTAL